MLTSSPSQLVLYECHHCGMVAHSWGKVAPAPVCICGHGMVEVTDRYLVENRKPVWHSRGDLPS